MKLFSGKAFIATKNLAFASLAVAAAGLAPVALAETNAAPSPETATALKCLLKNGQDGCDQVFVSSARLAARPWIGQNSNRDFRLGALLSANYALTKTGDDVYIAKFLHSRTTDLYDVKFKNQELTFYISRPETDGKIRYLLIRNGGPNPADERMDLFVHGPG